VPVAFIAFRLVPGCVMRNIFVQRSLWKGARGGRRKGGRGERVNEEERKGEREKGRKEERERERATNQTL